MLRHRNIDRICAVIVALTMALAALITAVAAGGGIEARPTAGYEERLFDTSMVHTIDIVMDDWDAFLKTCASEQYTLCSVVIDGEKLTSVAIRGKGNTSLSNVAQYGNNRYSFKLEFDHYQAGKSYYGLDKLCLNNLIQDSTAMKDYLAYTLMRKNGVAAPLCSFVKINVNGEYWGLYLAVEAVEDAFMTRNYGDTSGEMYKPDSIDMGGGKGFGGEFRMSDFKAKFEQEEEEAEKATATETTSAESAAPEGFDPGNFDPSTFTPPEGFEPPQGGPGSGGPGGAPGGFGFGSSDVKLVYTDDDPDSYSNIFGNAKTDINDGDKARLIASLKTLNEGENIESVVDVESVIRYFVVHSFMVNGDSYTGSMIHNYYLYEDNGVLSMIPWDYNLAFGGFSMGMSSGTDSATSAVNDPIDTPVSGGDVTSRPMLAWIFANEEYTALYHKIYAEFMADIYDSGWLAEEIDRVWAMIAPCLETDPTAFYTYEEFEKGVETLKTFVDLRCQSVKGQLDGTIPATTAGQSADTAALIDASSISISDMGSMGGGGGPGSSHDNSAAPSMPTAMTLPEGMSPPEGMTPPETATETDDATASKSDRPSPPGDFAGMPGGMEEPQTTDPKAIPLAVASIVLLLAGLVFAKRSRVCR